MLLSMIYCLMITRVNDCFMGRLHKPLKVGIEVSGQYVNIYQSTVHLGHNISSINIFFYIHKVFSPNNSNIAHTF